MWSWIRAQGSDSSRTGAAVSRADRHKHCDGAGLYQLEGRKKLLGRPRLILSPDHDVTMCVRDVYFCFSFNLYTFPLPQNDEDIEDPDSMTFLIFLGAYRLFCCPGPRHHGFRVEGV